MLCNGVGSIMLIYTDETAWASLMWFVAFANSAFSGTLSIGNLFRLRSLLISAITRKKCTSCYVSKHKSSTQKNLQAGIVSGETNLSKPTSPLHKPTDRKGNRLPKSAVPLNVKSYDHHFSSESKLKSETRASQKNSAAVTDVEKKRSLTFLTQLNDDIWDDENTKFSKSIRKLNAMLCIGVLILLSVVIDRYNRASTIVAFSTESCFSSFPDRF
mmetsp:Transcript_47005/g.75544  ORF Transcript_47005/g.75544 Transcript_47005/m.75544 type:complete len:215 (+) Transcript_47005:1097-1741(+)